MKISIDVISRKVVGISLPASPFLFSVEVPDNFTLSKTIQEEILPEISLPQEEITEREEIAEKKFSYKTVIFKDSPTEFTYAEVVDKKKAIILSTTGKENIIHREFPSENAIDLTYPEHKANTGVKLVSILPFGKIRLNTIALSIPARTFSLVSNLNEDLGVYLNGEMVDSATKEIVFSEPQSNLEIIIENYGDMPCNLEEFTIVY